MKVFNPMDFRREFPALSDKLTYLDSAATALKPRAMIDATQQFISRIQQRYTAANINRRCH